MCQIENLIGDLFPDTMFAPCERGLYALVYELWCRICFLFVHRSQMQSLPFIYSHLDLNLQIQGCKCLM